LNTDTSSVALGPLEMGAHTIPLQPFYLHKEPLYIPLLASLKTSPLPARLSDVDIFYIKVVNENP